MSIAAGLICVGLAGLVGCNGLAIRSQSPEPNLDQTGSEVPLVGDLAVPFGLHPIRVEAVGLVTQLPGTGSDPAPSPQRSALLAEMQTLGVINPNRVLSDPTTDLVLVQGFLRPGIQKGDRFDVEVRVPSRSENQGLRGGWLMKTRLRQMAVLGNAVRSGDLFAIAQGPILVDPSAQGKDARVELSRGRILGGGVCKESRQLGLALKPDHRSVRNSADIGGAINRRFHTFRGGTKEGVARPKSDEYIDLAIHPRYKDNVERFVRVIRALPVRETAEQQMARLKVLKQQLLDPVTASAAALQLEALGKAGTDVLHEGLAAQDPEVRFYSAEALAYLDDRLAAEPLGQIAREIPAFRAFALAALSAMDDFAASEALKDLLSVPSVETRYGAFRSLWAMNANDPLVGGENLGQQFSYHVLNTSGDPMVHVTRSYRPEIVLFGHQQRFETPLLLQAGNEIMVNTVDAETLSVSRFSVGNPDQKRVVSTKVDDVIRAIVELGGTYPDVVQALQHAKATRALKGRLEIDALPQVGRTYQRGRQGALTDGEGPDGAQRDVSVANPLPGLFQSPTSQDAEAADGDEEGSESSPSDGGEKQQPWKRFFDRIAGDE